MTITPQRLKRLEARVTSANVTLLMEIQFVCSAEGVVDRLVVELGSPAYAQGARDPSSRAKNSFRQCLITPSTNPIAAAPQLVFNYAKPWTTRITRSGPLTALSEWRVTHPEMAGLPNHRFSNGSLVGRGFRNSYVIIASGGPQSEA